MTTHAPRPAFPLDALTADERRALRAEETMPAPMPATRHAATLTTETRPTPTVTRAQARHARRAHALQRAAQVAAYGALGALLVAAAWAGAWVLAALAATY